VDTHGTAADAARLTGGSYFVQGEKRRIALFKQAIDIVVAQSLGYTDARWEHFGVHNLKGGIQLQNYREAQPHLSLAQA